MDNPFSLEDRNILVTGASSGIGRQCALSCSQMGATLVLIGRSPERLLETKQSLTGSGHLHYSLDLTSYSEIETVVRNAVSKVGNISGFIHSAGMEITLPFRNTSPETYHQVMSVNVLSGFEIARILSHKKYMRPSGSSFVFISSVMGSLGEPGKAAYCASKGALIAGAKSMALELANKKIRVNTVSPAMVDSRMTAELFQNISAGSKEEILNNHPLGIGDPLDVALACVYLLSNGAKWVTGTNLIVDGGYSAR